MRTQTNKAREQEIALVICSPHAQHIADAIARAKRVGPYRLVPVRPQFIRDVYFDTRAGALQAHDISLRIRRVNGKTLITFKESLAREKRGVQARVEIERRWSRAACLQIGRELQARGIAIEKWVYHPSQPRRTLQRAGLLIIQQRVTWRRVRRVFEAEHECAELAIDKTTFCLGTQAIHLHEVEIEATRAPTCLDALAQQLETLFAPALKPWYSKLATGQMIEVLLKQGVLPSLLDAQNNLTPAALARIESEWNTTRGDTHVH